MMRPPGGSRPFGLLSNGLKQFELNRMGPARSLTSWVTSEAVKPSGRPCGATLSLGMSDDGLACSGVSVLEPGMLNLPWPNLSGTTVKTVSGDW